MNYVYVTAAQDALEQFALDCADLQFISHSENVSFRVDTRKQGCFVLRLHRPTYHDLQELVSEQLWTEALLESGVDVPVAIRTTSGQRYASVDCSGEQRYAGVLEWVDGDLLRDPATYSELSEHGSNPYRLLGRLIAQLHDQAVDWEPPREFTRHSFNMEGFVGEDPFWGRFWECGFLSRSQRKRLLELRDGIREILTQYGESTDTYSLIHADLHESNVVVSGDRLHIIDFDDAGFGWHAYDLAVALNHRRDLPDYKTEKDALLEGYCDIRRINSKDIEMIDVFFVVRSLASIGWVTARPEVNPKGHEVCQSLYEDAVSSFDQLGT